MKPYVMRIASIAMFSFIAGTISSQIGQEQPGMEAYIFTWYKALLLFAVMSVFYIIGFWTGQESERNKNH